jgi:periplasmic protein TonB
MMLQIAKAKRVLLLITVLTGCASHPPGETNTASAQPSNELVSQAIENSRPAAQYVRDLEKNYDSRPKKRFVSGQKAGEFQPYVTACLGKIQRIGVVNYPDEARGKLYGNVVVTFALARNGQLEQAVIERSSGHKVLDDAIIKAIKLSAPFPAFPQDSPEQVDQLVIVQRFSFAKGQTNLAQDDREIP